MANFLLIPYLKTVFGSQIPFSRSDFFYIQATFWLKKHAIQHDEKNFFVSDNFEIGRASCRERV